MMTHSGRLVETSHEFRVNIRNTRFTFVPEDLSTYAKNRKAEGLRRKTYAKYNNGMRASRLAANIIDTLSAEQIDMLMGGGSIHFKSDGMACDMQAKKLEINAFLRIDGAVITNKSVQLTVIVPQSLAHSLIGESLRKVIEHPLITDDMIITEVDSNLGSPFFKYKAPNIFFKE